MDNNFIEHKNFFKIYIYNRRYRKEHRRHNRALNFQIVIAVVCIIITAINISLDANFVNDLYIDQINRIYALLVALLTAILIGITPLDHSGKLTTQQYDYETITYKQDYVSILMYTLFLYLIGIVLNIFYAVNLQYLNINILDMSFWTIHIFILLDSLFFTVYCVDELADIVKFVK